MCSENPFPGMHPWLERWWESFHNSMVLRIADGLNSLLLPHYAASNDVRIVIDSTPSVRRQIRPDVGVLHEPRLPPENENTGGVAVAEPLINSVAEPVETREFFVKIFDNRSGRQLVTVIELLSPSNKAPAGDRRTKYLEKQAEIRGSSVNLVEIDLLRSGAATTIVASSVTDPLPGDYHASVWRARRPGTCELYPMSMRLRLPTINIPLATNDADVPLDLQAALDAAYTRGRLGFFVDHSAALHPPLDLATADWAAERLAEADG